MNAQLPIESTQPATLSEQGEYEPVLLLFPQDVDRIVERESFLEHTRRCEGCLSCWDSIMEAEI